MHFLPMLVQVLNSETTLFSVVGELMKPASLNDLQVTSPLTAGVCSVAAPPLPLNCLPLPMPSLSSYLFFLSSVCSVGDASVAHVFTEYLPSYFFVVGFLASLAHS